MLRAIMAGKSNISPRQLSFTFSPARPEIERRLSSRLRANVRIVYTDNSRTMISPRKAAGGTLVLRLHHMFKNADGKIIAAISEYLKNGGRLSSRLLDEFISKNHHLIRRKARQPRPGIETGGQFHDLIRYYRELNQRYFGGKLDVAITWGNRARRRGQNHIRLGSYSFENRLIRVHPALDKKWIPRYYVKSIIYHEMLHAEFGVRNKNGRCQFHTGAFREREEAFSYFHRAREWEKKSIRRLI